MTSSDIAIAPALPATLRLGGVELTVSDLDRSVGWYEEALGLRVHARSEGRAALGAGGEDLVVLVEQPGAQPAGRHAGLFHYALLYASREELARTAVRLAATRTPISGASDHGTHEALYLADPDGNGIELAADRPRSSWPDVRSVQGYAGGPRPLDVPDLLRTVAGEAVQPLTGEGLTMGHLHLHVGDVEEGIAFYCGALGFELMVSLGSAAFVSAGGYHHHLGFNVWAGQGVGPAPADAVGLRHWTVRLGAAEEVEAVRARLTGAGHPVEEREGERGFLVRDPWGTAVLVLGAG